MLGPRPRFDFPPFPLPFPLAALDGLALRGVRDLVRFGAAAALGWLGFSAVALMGNGKR